MLLTGQGPSGSTQDRVLVDLRWRMLWFGTVALLCVIKGSAGTEAGLKAQLTQKGLDYGRQVGVAVLQSELQKISIPDQSGSYPIPVVGNVDYTFSEMQIQDFQLQQSSSGFISGTGIKVSIDDAQIHITGNWHAKLLFISDSGSFDLSVDGLSISAILGVTRDDTGHPAVRDSGCSSAIGGLDITFHGGASWLYNLFSGALEGPIRDLLNGQLCPQVGSGIADLEQVLKTIPVSVQIDPAAEIDYSLVDNPVTIDRYMDLGFKGEFYNVGHHSEPPFTPAPFPIPDQDSQMLYIGVSEFFANSAGYVYFTAGVLEINITNDMIPKEFPIRLNTESFGSFIPQLPKLYPNMSMMLYLSAQKQPMMTCQPGDLNLEVQGLVYAFVVFPNSTKVPVFILQLDSKVKAKVSISGQKIVGSLVLNNFTLSLRHSDVGPFKVNMLQTLVSVALNVVVLPKVNAKLSEGFALPTIAHLNLVNPTVMLNQGYVLISTDVQYAP